ncbi:hypothetical protein [Mucilaginibacter sp. HD30]
MKKVMVLFTAAALSVALLAAIGSGKNLLDEKTGRFNKLCDRLGKHEGAAAYGSEGQSCFGGF